MAIKFRRSGLDLIGEVPWGTHICQFYRSKEDSLSIVVPYIKSGLENDEACMWVTSGAISVADARDALRRAHPDTDKNIEEGRLEILDSSEWYTKGGEFNIDKTLEGWGRKSVLARERGYAGLRVTGDTSWLTADVWASFMEYEAQVSDAVDRAQMIALCSYDLGLLDAFKVMQVVSTHQFCLIRQDVGEEKWRLVENIERKHAIQAALASEEKYRRVVENIPLAIYSVLPDKGMTPTLLSDKVEGITGYSAKEILADPSIMSRMIHPEDIEGFRAAAAEHRKNKTRLHYDFRITPKGGGLKWISYEAQPVVDGKGNMIRIDGFLEDITERREVEEALKRSEERYMLAQRAANMGSWDWNIASGALSWSDEIEPLFGFKKGQFGGTYEAFVRCIHPEDRKLVQDAVNACLERNDIYDIEHRVVWPDGTVRWMSEKGDVIRDKKGAPVRMVGIVRDITVRREQEEMIRGLNRDLERRSAELSETNKELEAFTYSISHDLRGPLRRIDGFSEILSTDYSPTLDEKAKSYISRIRNSVRGMDQLIDDMLRLSRLNTAELSMDEVDLGSMANAILEGFARSEPGRKVAILVHGDLKVTGDPDLLRVAMDNLLGNAWKFTSKNPKARIEFSVTETDGGRTFYVRDDGVGFDAKRAERLFIPFQRFHTSEEFPGTGLGLSLVRRVITRHGGSIWVDSSQGKGATFFFTLGR